MTTCSWPSLAVLGRQSEFLSLYPTRGSDLVYDLRSKADRRLSQVEVSRRNKNNKKKACKSCAGSLRMNSNQRRPAGEKRLKESDICKVLLNLKDSEGSTYNQIKSYLLVASDKVNEGAVRRLEADIKRAINRGLRKGTIVRSRNGLRFKVAFAVRVRPSMRRRRRGCSRRWRRRRSRRRCGPCRRIRGDRPYCSRYKRRCCRRRRRCRAKKRSKKPYCSRYRRCCCKRRKRSYY